MPVQPEPAIPFAFLVSLLQAIASIKPKQANKTHSSNHRDAALRTLDNWIVELHRRYSPLPPETTTVFFRLFFPEEDVARKYGIQEKRLYEYLCDIFNPRGTSCEWARQLQAVQDVGCFGSRVQKAFEAVSVHTADCISLQEVDVLLTALASSCAFSSLSVRNSLSQRSPRDILKALYTSVAASSTGFLTQIILKDLRPILYPISELHYTASLLQYNSKAVSMLTKEDVMRAWDPSGRMLRMYRVRASLDDAAHAYDHSSEEIHPQLGIPIEIPKCLKGQSCKNSVKLLRKSKKVWAETKYDGERAQIHVLVDESGKSHITIFSKSKRDSTLDRYAVHFIIRQALGLPENATTKNFERSAQKVVNIVLEAEMVAFSDTLNKIDEFWRIRSLIASTARGVRRRPRPLARHVDTDDSQLADASQSSLISNASDDGTRHLALVFFDILYLNSQSLLSRSYSDRRNILEQLLILQPGYAMIAERFPINMCSEDTAVEQLEGVFAKLLADHQEGAVLKAEESRYCDWSLQWVKLKTDYIPGYGDCLDLVLIGAGWDKDRAAELRVCSSVYTTFYFGALTNSEDLRLNPDAKPHFSGIFTSSYGLHRKKLEEVNFMIKSSDPVFCDHARKRPFPDMPYTYDMPSGLARPSILLQTPILAELFGAGFTKAPQCTFYELRFPRISKIFRPSERSWKDGCTSFTSFQAIAREAVGRDRPNKDVEDWCNGVWGKPVSPGVNASPKRRRREDEWVDRLARADGRVKRAKRTGELYGDSRDKEEKERKEPEEDEENFAQTKRPMKRSKVQAFGSVTNMLRGANVGPSSLLNYFAADDAPSSITHVNNSGASSTTFKPMNLQLHEVNPSFKAVRPQAETTLATRNIIPPRASGDSQFEDGAALLLSPTSSPGSTSATKLQYADTPLGEFLSSAVVWLFRPTGTPRPPWRVPSGHIIQPGHQVCSFNAFLMACGWSDVSLSVTSPCRWAERGVLFVDEADTAWVDTTLRRLVERRAALVQERPREGGMASKGWKPVWVLSMRCLSYEEVVRHGDIENRALCRLG